MFCSMQGFGDFGMQRNRRPTHCCSHDFNSTPKKGARCSPTWFSNAKTPCRSIWKKTARPVPTCFSWFRTLGRKCLGRPGTHLFGMRISWSSEVRGHFVIPCNVGRVHPYQWRSPTSPIFEKIPCGLQGGPPQVWQVPMCAVTRLPPLPLASRINSDSMSDTLEFVELGEGTFRSTSKKKLLGARGRTTGSDRTLRTGLLDATNGTFRSWSKLSPADHFET